MTYEPIWGGIIAWYLFLAGLGGGAFITSAFLKWTKPEATTMRRIGHIIAPVVVIIGLVLLMFDAKAGFLNPLRFALLLTNFGSVMTWGVVFLASFTVIALVVLLLDFLKKPIPNWLDIVGVIAGVCVAIYTGVLLGVCQTFPLWNNALLPILFLVSALSTGAASVIAVGILVKPEEFNEIGILKKTHYALPAIEILAGGIAGVHHRPYQPSRLQLGDEPYRRPVERLVLDRLRHPGPFGTHHHRNGHAVLRIAEV